MSQEESFIVGIFAALGIFILLVFLIGIIFYVLNAIGLFAIAKKTDRADLAFLAWIPLANAFLVALLVEDDVHEEIRGKFTLIFAITFVVSMIFSWVFAPLSLLYTVAYMYAFYFIAKKYSDKAVAHTVIGAVTLGASTAISFFRFRKRDPIVN